MRFKTPPTLVLEGISAVFHAAGYFCLLSLDRINEDQFQASARLRLGNFWSQAVTLRKSRSRSCKASYDKLRKPAFGMRCMLNEACGYRPSEASGRRLWFERVEQLISARLGAFLDERTFDQEATPANALFDTAAAMALFLVLSPDSAAKQPIRECIEAVLDYALDDPYPALLRDTSDRLQNMLEAAKTVERSFTGLSEHFAEVHRVMLKHVRIPSI